MTLESENVVSSDMNEGLLYESVFVLDRLNIRLSTITVRTVVMFWLITRFDHGFCVQAKSSDCSF